MAQYFHAGARPKQKYFHDSELGQQHQDGFHLKTLDQNLDAAAASAANRRRKKRGGSGIKTVDVARGKFGFGFTLSGQNPCILSSVIEGSPAERVGLVSGNCLIAVNHQNVAKLAHSEVVKLISQCSGVLTVTVGDSNNFISDTSSDEEDNPRASRPKYPHHRKVPVRREGGRPLAEISTNQNRDLWLLNNQLNRSRENENFQYQSDTESTRIEQKIRSPQVKHVRSNSADSSFIDIHGSSTLMSTPKKIKNSNQQNHKKVELNAGEELTIGSELNNYFNHNLSELRKSIKLQNHRKLNMDLSTAEYKCVVGYLGTIEMPKGVSQSGGLQDIRNCIRRLRVEKKVHTLVLFCIFPSQVVLINHHGLKLAVFAAENIKFCGVYPDDRRFFGLVTSHVGHVAPETSENQNFSSSCHVFMAEPITSQTEREIRAGTFQFDLSDTTDIMFPANADPVLNVIYKLRGLSPAQEAASLQPPHVEVARSSPGSSAASNSDSGIGYRDEALHPQGADRALVVDVQNERIRLQNLTRLQEQQEAGVRPSHNVSMSSSDTPSLPFDNERSRASPAPLVANVSSSKLTVRAMPDPDASFNTDRLESLQSAEHIRQSMQKYLADKQEHLKKTSQQLADKTDKIPSANPPVDRSTVSSSRPTSFVRSLEDLRSVETGSVYSNPDADLALGPPSLPVNPHLPLARFLYSSDSNLSGLVDTGTVGRSLDLANHPLTKWQEAQGSYNKTVLRPCDQYPDLGLVRRRDRSAASSTTSNRSYRASVHVESSEYDTCSWTRGHVSQHHSLQRKEKVNVDDSDRRDTLGSHVRKRERRKSDSASIMNDAGDTKSVTGSQGGGSPSKEVSRVGSWAADFDKLLADPAGLQTFAEFLKKEFSHENIYFWCACEKYKSLETGADRLKYAKEVIERHLEAGASEPVNVDSIASSTTQEQLASSSSENPPSIDLFKTAQTQIYNLMKFDSFSRFLKSDLYKDSLLADMAGNPLQFNGEDLELDLVTSMIDLDKSDSSIKKSGEGRRKSILPWNNIRNRSKSKDRADQNLSSESKPVGFIKKLTGQNSNNGDKNRQSSNSFEAVKSEKDNSQGGGDPLNHASENCDKEQCSLTRFILPDRATTVVSTPSGETIRSLVSRLLDKRGLKFTSFDAFITGNDKPLDLSEDCSTLGCSEVRVEPRVLFRLELPSKKSIGVKAKQTKLVEEVLGPILSQYGWNLSDMSVRLDQVRAIVDLKASVTSIDNTRLVVTHKEDAEAIDQENESSRSDSRPNSRSSQSMGPRRASSSSVESVRNKPGDDNMMPPPKIIPMNRRRPPLPQPPVVPLQPPSTPEASSDLYEGLKRMTRGRLDDQRGLEINTELPEFLRKSGGLETRVSEPFRMEAGSRAAFANSRMSGPAGYMGLQQTEWDKEHAKHYIDYIDSTFTSEGHVPNMAEAEEVFTPVNPDESLNFNESRLSLGMGRLSMGSVGSNNYQAIDGMRLVTRPSFGAVRDYEGVVMNKPPQHPQQLQQLQQQQQQHHPHLPQQHPAARGYSDYESLRMRPGSRSQIRDYDAINFNSRKDYEALTFRSAHPPMIAPKPRLSSVEEVPLDQPKRPPPPLPPKPVRGPPPLPPHAQHLHNNFGKPQPPEGLPMGVTRTKNGVYLGIPGEKGYNVSFV